ncbi:MAG: hypothetical protein H6849_01935 [Alphaproteobacteria bacterium]|nr:MAG: hypothetical protein H6849_01935 [Alphaproteobacteria bacterium]
MIAPLQTGIVTFLAQHHHILDHEKWLCVYQMDSHTRMVASQGGSIVDDRPFSVADDFWHKHRGVGPILVDSSLKKINIPVRSVWKSVDIPHENMTAILPHITPCLRMSFMTPNPKVLQVFRLHRALKWVEKISILFLIVGSVFGVSLGIDCYTKRCLSSINISPPLRKTKYSPMRNKTHETLGQKLRKFHRNPHRKVFTHDF